jgi:CheY-like chemotaxis protein
MPGYDRQIAWRRSNPHEAGAFIVRVGARHMEEPVTVLFVEDDDGVRESVAELLAARGFRMLVAQDAGEALRLLAENRVDALFTDIVMPGNRRRRSGAAGATPPSRAQSAVHDRLLRARPGGHDAREAALQAVALGGDRGRAAHAAGQRLARFGKDPCERGDGVVLSDARMKQSLSPLRLWPSYLIAAKTADETASNRGRSVRRRSDPTFPS